MTLLKDASYKPFTTCLFVLLTQFSLTTTAATFLEIDTDEGEFLFQGKDVNVSDDDGDFALFYSAPNQLSGGFTWSTPAADKYNIQLTFFSGTDKKFQVGPYLNTKGPGWLQGQIEPALDVNLIGAGRGCSSNTGEFVVYEFEPTAKPPRYAINFTQYCVLGNQAQIRGILRINSNFPKQDSKPLAAISLPEPKAIEGKQYRVSGENSRAQQGEIIRYEWSQVSGPAVTFIDSTQETALITLPKSLPLGGADILLQLTVTNTAGNSATAQTSIHVDSKSDPQSFFRSVTGTEFPTNDANWQLYIGQNNLINAVGGSWGVMADISTSTSAPPEYRVSINPPENQNLQPGLYENARRFAGATAGLDFSANGFGCNASYGSFNVLSIQNEGDLLTQFHARFTHYCESLAATPTSGEIAFNVFDPNVPKINIAVPQTILEGDTVTLDASASVDNIGSITTYQWTGPNNIVIENSNKAIASFKAPALTGTAPLLAIFKLHVTDNEGYQAEKSVTLTISPKPKSSSASSSSAKSSTANTSGSNTSVSNSNGSGSGGGGAASLWYCLGLLMLVLLQASRLSLIRTGCARDI
ncbi:PKD domain-containing protein [Cellvibrio sp. UBA7671]|uniref:PKD domain-containing protein n=1 Tax=Cellvibrio sp. UBA7671 TaxID=1946312 RepID=UPI002F3559A3